MKKDSKASGQGVFALHMLFQVPIRRPLIDRFDHANLFDFPSLKSIMFLDSITEDCNKLYHRTFNHQLSISLER